MPEVSGSPLVGDDDELDELLVVLDPEVLEVFEPLGDEELPDVGGLPE